MQGSLKPLVSVFAEDPLVPSLATLANNNPEEYLRRAKLFTQKFAK